MKRIEMQKNAQIEKLIFLKYKSRGLFNKLCTENVLQKYLVFHFFRQLLGLFF